MLTLALPAELEDRLRFHARRLGKPAEACAEIAIRSWVEDCDAAAQRARQLGGDPVMRPPDEFWD